MRACLRRNRPGPFQIQAAIAAVHADAPTAEATDWPQIVALYDQLHVMRPDASWRSTGRSRSASCDGADAGLDRARRDRRRRCSTAYQPFHAARADLLARAGQLDDAVTAYDRAIELTTNPTERRFLRSQRSRVVRPLPN